MKECPNCKAMVPDVAKFCIKCRFNIKEYEEKQNKPLFCMECGAEIVEGATFCMECGTDVVMEKVSVNTDLEIDFSALNDLATNQLYEKEGFKVDNGVLIEYTGKRRIVAIPGIIEEIFDKVFENNEFVTKIELQEGIKAIGRRAFANCKSLVEINIPSSIKELYEDTFYRTSLETVMLTKYDSNIVKSVISENARKLLLDGEDIHQYISENNGRVVIDIKALEKKATLKAQEKEEKHKREEAEKLRIAEEARRQAQWEAEEIKRKKEAEQRRKEQEEARIKAEFDIENGVLVKYKGDSERVVIPNTVVSIGDSAFYDYNLKKPTRFEFIKSIEIPNGVKSIGDLAFYDCKRLEKVTIPGSVRVIGRSAFYNCKALTSVEIPYGVKIIGENAFSSCEKLKEVTLANSVEELGRGVFNYCYGLTDVTLSDKLTVINEFTFCSCKSLKNIKIPRSVKIIGKNAFSSCCSLASVTIPGSVEDIRDDAFGGCTGLFDLEICYGVKLIGDSAFKDCTSLIKINIPRSMISIGAWSFHGCTRLRGINIPDSVTWVGSVAFRYCKNATITCDSTCQFGRWNENWNCDGGRVVLN